jgi:hypothetical protein
MEMTLPSSSKAEGLTPPALDFAVVNARCTALPAGRFRRGRCRHSTSDTPGLWFV